MPSRSHRGSRSAGANIRSSFSSASRSRARPLRRSTARASLASAASVQHDHLGAHQFRDRRLELDLAQGALHHRVTLGVEHHELIRMEAEPDIEALRQRRRLEEGPPSLDQAEYARTVGAPLRTVNLPKKRAMGFGASRA